MTCKIIFANGWNCNNRLPSYIFTNAEVLERLASGALVYCHRWLGWCERCDYDYPNEDPFFNRSGSTAITRSDYKPDGTARVEINEKSELETVVNQYTTADVANHWEDIPQTPDDSLRIGRLERFLA